MSSVQPKAISLATRIPLILSCLLVLLLIGISGGLWSTEVRADEIDFVEIATETEEYQDVAERLDTSRSSNPSVEQWEDSEGEITFVNFWLEPETPIDVQGVQQIGMYGEDVLSVSMDDEGNVIDVLSFRTSEYVSGLSNTNNGDPTSVSFEGGTLYSHMESLRMPQVVASEDLAYSSAVADDFVDDYRDAYSIRLGAWNQLHGTNASVLPLGDTDSCNCGLYNKNWRKFACTYRVTNPPHIDATCESWCASLCGLGNARALRAKCKVACILVLCFDPGWTFCAQGSCLLCDI